MSAGVSPAFFSVASMQAGTVSTANLNTCVPSMERTFGAPPPRPGRRRRTSSPGCPARPRWRASPPGTPPRRRPRRLRRGCRCPGPSNPPLYSGPPPPPTRPNFRGGVQQALHSVQGVDKAGAGGVQVETGGYPPADPAPAAADRRQRAPRYPPRRWPRCTRRCPPG